MIIESKYEKKPISYNTLGEARCYPELLKLLLTTLEDEGGHFSNNTWVFDCSNTLEPLFFRRLGHFGSGYISQLSFKANEIVKALPITNLLDAIVPLVETSTEKRKNLKQKILDKKIEHSNSLDGMTKPPKSFEKAVLAHLSKYSSKLFNILFRGVKLHDKSIIKLDTKGANTFYFVQLSFLKYFNQIASCKHKKPHRVVIYDPEGVFTKDCALASLLNQKMKESRKHNIGVGYFTCKLEKDVETKVPFFQNIHHILSTSKKENGDENPQPVLGADVSAIYQRYDGKTKTIPLKQLGYFKNY